MKIDEKILQFRKEQIGKSVTPTDITYSIGKDEALELLRRFRDSPVEARVFFRSEASRAIKDATDNDDWRGAKRLVYECALYGVSFQPDWMNYKKPYMYY